jgi:ABC-type multidrug transport system fused ATPase/permease subunit
VNNLVTTDAERIAQGFTFSHFLWSSPVEVVISALLAYLEIGWPALVGLVLLVLQMPIQAHFGSVVGKYRKKVVAQTDERVRMMNEVLGGVRTIKIFGWEAAFYERIMVLRDRERAQLWNMQVITESINFLTIIAMHLPPVKFLYTRSKLGAQRKALC